MARCNPGPEEGHWWKRWSRGSTNAMSLLTRDRECGISKMKKEQRRLHMATAFLRKLNLASELEGHTGCVNRLCWNESGSLLASGSDDKNVILWHYPFVNHHPVVVPTCHRGNIFGVKFMPCSGDLKIVTGSMDCSVQLHHLDRICSNPSFSTMTLPADHTDRVKAVEVEPCNPHNIWSASEDGTVRQLDTRALRDPNILLACWGNNGYDTDMKEVKSLCINKVCPYQIAVACGDEFVRVYDRRKLSLAKQITGPLFYEHGELMSLCPPHMRGTRDTFTTCVSFGNTGRRLAATWHGDNAYTFDLSSNGTLDKAIGLEGFKGPKGGRYCLPEDSNWKHLEEVTYPNRMRGTSLYDYVQEFTEALSCVPTATTLLTGRAHAYIKRGMMGDFSYALFDAEMAIYLDPSDPSPRKEQIEALAWLNFFEAARYLVGRFKEDFPEEDISTISKFVLDSIQEERKERRTKRKRNARKTVNSTDLEVRTYTFDQLGLTERVVEGVIERNEESDCDDGDEYDSDYSDSYDEFPDPQTAEAEVILDNLKKCSFSGYWRQDCTYQRYLGHSNFQTDTKEVSFIGRL
mmetsp:Transcript_4084/g.10439  ORF Transcript_4084/g.10439 Transcript_4084/m.10439 type:complete len:576 (-) Transcript_4084:1243-2970(-)